MKKWLSVMIITALASLLFAGIASAHVTVLPKEAKQGSFEVFTVRVPSEDKGTSTLKVRVAIPEGVNISRFEPKPGWKYELEKNGDGRITGVTWSAEDGGLGETEFGEFRMQGKVNDDATELVWKAYQTYKDGTLVEWTGAPGTDSPKPASLTVVVPGDGEGHGGGSAAGGEHDTGGAATDQPASDTGAGQTAGNAGTEQSTGNAATGQAESGADGDSPGADFRDGLTLALSIAAAVMSAIALGVAISRKRK